MAAIPLPNTVSRDPLITEHTIGAVRARIADWRSEGARIAFVATMGNLHEGHLSLVRAANSLADKVVASIFVNPLQFGPSEDFDDYPRTPDADRDALESVDCDLLFAPADTEMYPQGPASTRVTVGMLGDVLCGVHRVGHFDGMATVVTKLLSIVQPDIAVFGEKDFQQLVVIRRIVRDLNLPVIIHGVPTVRETDGLAMSSRNRYLNADERETAARLPAALRGVAGKINEGARNFVELCSHAALALRQAGLEPDYVEIRDAIDLSEPGETTVNVVILAAAVLGRTRLIDNVQVSLQA